LLLWQYSFFSLILSTLIYLRSAAKFRIHFTILIVSWWPISIFHIESNSCFCFIILSILCENFILIILAPFGIPFRKRLHYSLSLVKMPMILLLLPMLPSLLLRSLLRWTLTVSLYCLQTLLSLSFNVFEGRSCGLEILVKKPARLLIIHCRPYVSSSCY
jgi:hypothetical protein